MQSPKPCPFCNGTAMYILHRLTTDGWWSYVRCLARDCGASGPLAEHEAYAIERWNAATRTTVKASGLPSIRALHVAALAAREADDAFTGDDASVSYMDIVDVSVRADTVLSDATADLRGTAWDYWDTQTPAHYDALISAALQAHATDTEADSE